MGECCCVSAGSSAWDKAMSPRCPHRGEGDLPKSCIIQFRTSCRSHKRKTPYVRIPPWRCCCLDDFTQLFKDWQQHHLIPSDRQRQQAGRLSLGQMLHHGALPSLPRQGLQAFLRLWSGAGVSPLLAGLPSTSRFVALRPGLLLPFDLLLHCFRGQKTGIYVVDHQGQIMAVKITGGNMDTANHWSP